MATDIDALRSLKLFHNLFSLQLLLGMSFPTRKIPIYQADCDVNKVPLIP